MYLTKRIKVKSMYMSDTSVPRFEKVLGAQFCRYSLSSTRVLSIPNPLRS